MKKERKNQWKKERKNQWKEGKKEKRNELMKRKKDRETKRKKWSKSEFSPSGWKRDRRKDEEDVIYTENNSEAIGTILFKRRQYKRNW